MDTRTLSFTIAMVGIAIALATALFAAFRRERGLYIYAAGFLSAAAAFLLFLGQAALPRWTTYILANMLLIFYQFCMSWGLRSYFRIGKGWPRRFWGYMAAWLVLLLAGTYALDSFIFRAVTASGFIILASAEFLAALRRITHETPPVVRRVAWGTICAFIACHLLRIGLLMAGSGRRIYLMDNTIINTYTFSFSLFFSVLWAGLILIIDASHLVTQLEKKNATLESLATSDELTGLRNRHTLDAKLNDEMERASRYRVSLSVILFDIDHFKRVNDTWGHQTGDAVLKRMADLTGALVRQPDDLFRWGGEEFLLVAPHTGLHGAVTLAEKLRVAVEAEIFPDAGAVTASFGVAEWRYGEDRDEWFRRVDQALYRAKNTGRNRVVGFGEMDALPLARVHIDWKPEWDSGNRLVDDEHRALLDLSNNLMDVSLSGGDTPRMLEAIDALIRHIATHFGDEEKVLAECSYPELESHVSLHSQLIREALSLRKDVETGGSDVGVLFDFLVNRVVVEHLVREDSQYFAYTRQKQG